MALDFTERTATYSIVRFVVTDTGVGLSGDEMNRLFQRFAQVLEHPSSLSCTRRITLVTLTRRVVQRLRNMVVLDWDFL